MELNQVVQNRKTGKLYVVTGFVGKHFLELKEVVSVGITMNTAQETIATALHKEEFELAKSVNVRIEGAKLNVLGRSN